MKLMLFVFILVQVCENSSATPGLLDDFLSSFQIFDNEPIPTASCNIPVKDFSFKQPLLLQGKNLWKQIGPNLNITGKITLACTGGRNVLDGTEERFAQASCTGNKLRYAGKSLPADSVNCKTSISGDVQTTTQVCANGQGTWSHLGFDLRNGTFIDLYSVCYSQDNADALYSHHRIFGRSIPFKQIEPRRPEFKSAGSAPGVSPANAYKGTTQLETFTRLLGENQAKRYINGSRGMMLARGHLSPDADFPLVPLQFATYFYINACPQWQTVNAGNWLKVETMVRQLATRRKDDFEIYTGIYGILTLTDENNNNKEIYLAERKKISVPKWLWKIVYHPRKKEGIALITLNNPHVQNKPHVLCSNICEESNWAQDVFNLLSKGFTYCCNVNELRDVIPIIPSLNVRKILQFQDK